MGDQDKRAETDPKLDVIVGFEEVDSCSGDDQCYTCGHPLAGRKGVLLLHPAKGEDNELEETLICDYHAEALYQAMGRGIDDILESFGLAVDATREMDKEILTDRIAEIEKEKRDGDEEPEADGFDFEKPFDDEKPKVEEEPEVEEEKTDGTPAPEEEKPEGSDDGGAEEGSSGEAETEAPVVEGDGLSGEEGE